MTKYIIIGPASYLLEKDNSLYISKDHNVFKSVAELYHPDIKVIEPENEKNKINLDQIKGLDKITYGTALESEYKILFMKYDKTWKWGPISEIKFSNPKKIIGTIKALVQLKKMVSRKSYVWVSL